MIVRQLLFRLASVLPFMKIISLLLLLVVQQEAAVAHFSRLPGSAVSSKNREAAGFTDHCLSAGHSANK